MKKEEIIFGDWQRLLLGQTPWIFLAEVFFRTLIIYLILLVILRLMGKRMGGQLTISELAVMLTLGAIVALPMQAPEKGLLEGVLVLLCAFAFQRGINLIGFLNRKAEEVLQGKESVLVKDGVLNVRKMRHMKISNQQLFAVLRSQSIYNLGEVERVYLEACGLFSVYKYEQARAGLSLLPTQDEAVHHLQSAPGEQRVCQRCGKSDVTNNGPGSECDNCGHSHWVPAIFHKDQLVQSV